MNKHIDLTQCTHMNVTHVNADQEAVYYDYGELITDTIFNDMSWKEIYMCLQKEHGRCTSKVYIDKADESIQIGWCFESLEKYDDTSEEFLRHTWVSFYKEIPACVTYPMEEKK